MIMDRSFIHILLYCVLIFLVLTLESVSGKHWRSSYQYQSEPRIVGGFPADRTSTRFIASLRLTIEEEFFEFGFGHKCGASLISEDVLISAAHCFFVYNSGPFDKELRDPCDWTIVLASYNRFTQESTTIVRSVRGITVHVDYDDSTMENDIALLFLNESVSLTPGVVEKIALNDKNLELGTSCQASGWGRIEYGGDLANDLQSVNILVVDVNVCNATESYGGEVHDGMLCVGHLEGGKDSCQGDSGGPLVCDGLLAGVVSWGYRCAQPNYPGIYTDVNYFNEWIQTSVDSGPEVLANCEAPIEPSTENPIYPSTVSEIPTSETSTSEIVTTPGGNGSFRSECSTGLVFLLVLTVKLFGL